MTREVRTIVTCYDVSVGPEDEILKNGATYDDWDEACADMKAALARDQLVMVKRVPMTEAEFESLSDDIIGNPLLPESESK